LHADALAVRVVKIRGDLAQRALHRDQIALHAFVGIRSGQAQRVGDRRQLPARVVTVRRDVAQRVDRQERPVGVVVNG
jgi:hypothetical protein